MTLAATWHRATDALCAREDATPLGLTRVIACVTLSTHVLAVLCSGAAGIVWAHEQHGGLSTSRWALALGPAGVVALAWLTVGSSACAAAGVGGRASLLVAWLSLRALSGLTPAARGGYDMLLVNILFILLLSGCMEAVTLRRGLASRTAERFARWLLVGQLTLLYFSSGLHKLSWSWLPGGDGSALWYALQQPMWSRLDTLPAWSAPVLALASQAVWWFEIAAPVFLLAFVLDECGSTSWLARALRRARFRSLYLACGALLHVGIELSMEVGAFSYASLALYPCALPIETWARMRAWRAMRTLSRPSDPS